MALLAISKRNAKKDKQLPNGCCRNSNRAGRNEWTSTNRWNTAATVEGKSDGPTEQTEATAKAAEPMTVAITTRVILLLLMATPESDLARMGCG